MYLIKKVSKNGKKYFVLVIKTGFYDDAKREKKEYINLTYTKGLELCDNYNINMYDDNEVKNESNAKN